MLSAFIYPYADENTFCRKPHYPDANGSQVVTSILRIPYV